MEVTKALVADGESTETAIPDQFIMFIVNCMEVYKKEFDGADEEFLTDEKSN